MQLRPRIGGCPVEAGDDQCPDQTKDQSDRMAKYVEGERHENGVGKSGRDGLIVRLFVGFELWWVGFHGEGVFGTRFCL